MDCKEHMKASKYCKPLICISGEKHLIGESFVLIDS